MAAEYFERDAEWFERKAKIAEAEGYMGLAEWLREQKYNWHTRATENWNEVGWSHDGLVEATAEKLTAAYAEQSDKRHVLRKLTLDLMCASFPEGQPPPTALVQLLKAALELPRSHEVGGWPVFAGTHDDRGNPDHEMRTFALRMDKFYLGKYGALPPLRELARWLEKDLHRKPDLKRLRQWRREAGLQGEGANNFLAPGGK